MRVWKDSFTSEKSLERYNMELTKKRKEQIIKDTKKAIKIINEIDWCAEDGNGAFKKIEILDNKTLKNIYSFVGAISEMIEITISERIIGKMENKNEK